MSWTPEIILSSTSNVSISFDVSGSKQLGLLLAEDMRALQRLGTNVTRLHFSYGARYINGKVGLELRRQLLDGKYSASPICIDHIGADHVPVLPVPIDPQDSPISLANTHTLHIATADKYTNVNLHSNDIMVGDRAVNHAERVHELHNLPIGYTFEIVFANYTSALKDISALLRDHRLLYGIGLDSCMPCFAMDEVNTMDGDTASGLPAYKYHDALHTVLQGGDILRKVNDKYCIRMGNDNKNNRPLLSVHAIQTEIENHIEKDKFKQPLVLQFFRPAGLSTNLQPCPAELSIDQQVIAKYTMVKDTGGKKDSNGRNEKGDDDVAFSLKYAVDEQIVPSVIKKQLERSLVTWTFAMASNDTHDHGSTTGLISKESGGSFYPGIYKDQNRWCVVVQVPDGPLDDTHRLHPPSHFKDITDDSNNMDVQISGDNEKEAATINGKEDDGKKRKNCDDGSNSSAPKIDDEVQETERLLELLDVKNKGFPSMPVYPVLDKVLDSILLDERPHHIRGRTFFLAHFDTEEEAKLLYNEAAAGLKANDFIMTSTLLATLRNWKLVRKQKRDQAEKEKRDAEAAIIAQRQREEMEKALAIQKEKEKVFVSAVAVNQAAQAKK